MRPLIVTEFVTLDGVMEAPGGEPSHPHSGWVGDYAGPEQTAWKLAEVREAGALLLGRVTYEGFAAAWPAREGEFADVMNSIPKHVVTSTLADPLEWSNATVLGGDLATGVGRLKAEDGGPVLVAGSGPPSSAVRRPTPVARSPPSTVAFDHSSGSASVDVTTCLGIAFMTSANSPSRAGQAAAKPS